MSEGTHAAHAVARRLLAHATWPAAAVAASAVIVMFAGVPSHGSPGYAGIVFATVVGLSGLVTLLLSLMLVLDALLFRLIASHASEAGGCAAVDDLLARMRLKPRPDRLRGIQERIAGTRRLMRRQRTALGVCVAACLALLVARAA